MSLDNEVVLDYLRNALIKIKNARTSLRSNQQILCNERLQGATDTLVHLARQVEKDTNESNADKEIQKAGGSEG